MKGIQTNVSNQNSYSKLMPETKSMEKGLKEAYAWYKDNSGEVNRRGYMEFIDSKWGRK
jgi:hypothetical protein